MLGHETNKIGTHSEQLLHSTIRGQKVHWEPLNVIGKHLRLETFFFSGALIRLKILCIVLYLDSKMCLLMNLLGLLKQVERAFSVCGTIEYMAPEIVEGGASGHDKVICTFIFYAAVCSIKSSTPDSPLCIPQCVCSPLRFVFQSAFLHSRRWTGGASAC